MSHLTLLEQQSLERLEFPQMLELLSTYCQSDIAKRQLCSFRPRTSLSSIYKQHAFYRDAMSMLVAMFDLPSLGVADLAPLLKRAALSGTVFSGEELLLFSELLEATTEVLDLFSEPEMLELYPDLTQWVQRLSALTTIRQAIKTAIAPDGTILDHASPKLAEIRQQQRSLSLRIQQTLSGLIKTETETIQEDFITERNGRFVIPIRREEKSRFPGVTHDMSNSGRTLFIEPTQTLPLGNELAENRLAERNEIRRILAECSYMIHHHIDDFSQNQRILVHLDIIFAIATWAVEYHASLPKFGKNLSLHCARHPLLDAQFRQVPDKILIPLNLSLPNQTKTLTITGSNTGGKTICLKTIGLLTLMAQTGLPVPADPESSFIQFRYILADIGDEQSINANLSTFSAHMETMKQILSLSEQGSSLILLDEIGAGTDPIEGAALACAELTELAKKNTLTIASTHLGAVKVFVHEQKDMINGAVRFNEKTLEPEYALDIGRPGASHALHIAERLHLPKSVIQKAKNFLSHDQIRLEKILLDMENTHREAESHRENLENLRQEAARKHQDLKAELETLRQERRDILNKAYIQAQSIIDNTRKQVENLQRQLSESGANLTQQQKEQFQETRQTLQDKKNRLTIGQEQTAPVLPETIPIQTLEVGQKVYIAKLRNYGRILTISSDKKSATVELDGLKFSIKTSEISQRDMTPSQPKKGTVTISKPLYNKCVKTELNLVGFRVDQALPVLSQFLSDATVAGLDEVRIVHGFGTGRLRDAIHEDLRRSKMVANYRLGIMHEDPGGNGVTIVTVAR